MNISVIGTGYVGLVSGTCFAEFGNHVICVDNNPEKLEMLKNGQVPIYEPGIEDLFERNIEKNRLTFTDSLDHALESSDIIFLCLPTPPMEDGSADLKYVLGVAGNIGKLMNDSKYSGKYKVIVNKSTVPVGTTELVQAEVQKNLTNSEASFDVVSNPEFLREGSAVEDFMRPDRVVIGTSSKKAEQKMSELYAPFVKNGNPVIYMDEKSSEMTKYAANSFLATKISFMNEVALLCEKVGADVTKVRTGMAPDERIGSKFLYAGVGYGGSCFPKDVSALHKIGAKNDYDFKILDSVMKVNSAQKLVLVEKIKDYYGADLSGKTFVVWGLAFKPNTDDIREAPALEIIPALQQMGATIRAYDPEAMEAVKKFTDLKMEYGNDAETILKNADALIIVTEWREFIQIDLSLIKNSLKNPVIFDGRNIYDPGTMQEHGFDYFSIGRPEIKGYSN